MTSLRTAVPAALSIIALGPTAAAAQSSLDTLLAPHRAAMATLVVLDGLWRGEGWTLTPTGARETFRQTIRVGSFGEGALKVIEGRSYDADGHLSATNFEIVSFNAVTKVYTLRLYAQGKVADVPIVPTQTGFFLEYPDGSATVRFTIAVNNGTWNEIAERRLAGQEPARFLELSLRRAGDTDWPAAGALPFRLR